MSMAFQATSSGQEIKNRKLLEQLEEQKKRLRLQSHSGASGGGSSTTTTANSSTLPTLPTPPISQIPQVQPQQPPASILFTDHQHMTPQQRAALQHAHANSVGYYITQDSSFGNLILPVLPRFDKPAT